MEQNNAVNIVTSIDGVGVVEAKNDLVSFSVSFKVKNDELEIAKSQVKEKTNSFLKELETKAVKLDGEIKTVLSSYKLEHRENGEKYAAGYQCIDTVTWTMVVDDKLNNIYSWCLKVDSSMSRPIFSIKDRASMLEQAIQKAADDVKQKFLKECRLLNVAPEALKIYNWNFGYEGYLPISKNYNGVAYGGAVGVTGPSSPLGAVGLTYSNAVTATKVGSIYQELLDHRLEPGMVTVRVPVEANYIWA